MKSNLSAITYIKNNKRICFVLVLSLAMTFAAMYVVAFTLNTTGESLKPVGLELPKRICFGKVGNDSLGVHRNDYEDANEYAAKAEEAREAFRAKLESDPDVERAYFTQVLRANYNGVLGGIGYEFPLLTPEEIPFVVKHLGAELVKGRMPEGDGEVLINEKVLRNGNMQVGDWFLKDVYGEVFRVVGVLRSDNMACVGTPRGFYNNGWYFTVLCNEKSCDFKALASKYGVTVSEENGDSLSDAPAYRKLYEKDVRDSIESVITAILAVVMAFLSISVMAAYVSFLRNRVNEYCLYASLGYSRSEIYGMIMREILFMFAAGILIGVGVALLIMKVFEAAVIIPKGLTARWWMGEQIMRIIGAFAVIIGTLQIPVMVAIYKIKTVDLMED